MSWTHKQRITVVAIVVLIAVVPLTLQIRDARASQMLEEQKQDLVEQTVTPSDYDGDTIPDSTDRCPTRPEEQNGFQDLDGCPDVIRTVRASEANQTSPVNQSGGASTRTQRSSSSDYDSDGIADSADRCPTRPEKTNGYQDGDGCPDVVSTTGAS